MNRSKLEANVATLIYQKNLLTHELDVERKRIKHIWERDDLRHSLAPKLTFEVWLKDIDEEIK